MHRTTCPGHLPETIPAPSGKYSLARRRKSPSVSPRERRSHEENTRPRVSRPNASFTFRIPDFKPRECNDSAA
jgi:hypothetical protein